VCSVDQEVVGHACGQQKDTQGAGEGQQIHIEGRIESG
jgi:hypothetical protein